MQLLEKGRKLQREQNDNVKENYRLKETERKIIYRRKKINRDNASNITQRNKTTGEKRRRENTAAKNDETKKLQSKVKMFSNETRRLKRKLDMY